MIRDQPQSFRNIRIREHRSDFRRFSLRQKDATGLVSLLELRLILDPEIMDQLRNRISMLGVVDRRCKKFFPWQLAKALVSFAPTIYCPRNGDSLYAILRHFIYALSGKVVDGLSLGSPSTGIQSIELLRLRIPINKEQVSADSVHHRLGHAENGIGGDGGINC